MKHYQRIKTIAMVVLMSIFFNVGFAQTHWNYVSPVPGSKFINPENTIAIRHGDVIKQTSLRSDLFTVKGSERGLIEGAVKLSLDGKTIIFTPSSPLNLGETVSVEVAEGIETESGLKLPGLSFNYTIKPVDNTKMLQDFYSNEEQQQMKGMENKFGKTNKVKNPAFKNANNFPEKFPPAHVTEFDSPTEGNIFCSPRPMGAAPYDPYAVIMDNYGTPVFYRQGIRRSNDFKLIVNNQLTYCDFDNGNVSVNKYIVMDSHFNITDTLLMGNGYIIDQHDMIMRENGDHFLMAYDPQLVNMDTVVPGGNPQATVIGFVIQELDADHNVIFQWRSWDHFEITDANHTDFLAGQIDYVHGNAFELDYDGNLLMSLRNMEEITKIDLNTGDIIWRFGLHAKNNMFDFLNDTVGFSWQHDVRRLENGNVTVYDNGNYHTPSFSQAVEFELDENNYTATLVWNYKHDPVIFGRATGANRRLENNNAFICWGLTWPVNYSEVTHDGSLAWDFGWTENVWDYRAFKFDWTTDLFEPSQDSIDFGTYDDYVPWPMIITLTNNSDAPIEITSTHNFLNSYQVVTPLPLEIPANGTVNFQFNLSPVGEEGQLDDVLTLNYDSYYDDTLHQRISKQIFVTAYVEDSNPPVATINPENGASDVARDIQIEISSNESLEYPDGSVIKTADIPNFLIFKEGNINGNDVAYTGYIDAWKRNIIIVPQQELTPGMQYYVELPGGTVADKEGHVMEDAVFSTFTTIDDIAPTAEINPADSTTGAFINQMITFTFDEPVQTIVGSEITSDDIQAFFNLKLNDADGEDVPFMGVINDDKTVVTIHPVDNLQSYQYYYVELVPDALMDMAGNVVSEMYYSHFETGEDVGIAEIDNIDISINPNPTHGSVEVQIDQEGSKLVELFDMSGRKIMEFKTGQNQISLNLRNQNKGLYLLKITSENHSFGLKKIVKE